MKISDINDRMANERKLVVDNINCKLGNSNKYFKVRWFILFYIDLFVTHILIVNDTDSTERWKYLRKI